jgi:hypothetical protein
VSDAPAWLSEFQALFGQALRAPLDAKTGTFRASPSRYPEGIRRASLGSGPVSADERLAVYNRQYWFRLFGVLQSAFPLTARLVGHFRFNGMASDFLALHPPRTWNIDDTPDGFEGFLSQTVPASGVRLPRSEVNVERRSLLEGAAIDAAWRRVFSAPQVSAYRPSAEDASRLLESRLVPSDTVAIFGEHRPLLDLRRRLGEHPGEGPVPLPPELPRPAWWALVRKPGGIGQLRLEPNEARLFILLRSQPVGHALALLESECSEADRAALPGRARAWLARSVELDFWSGLSEPEPPATHPLRSG